MKKRTIAIVSVCILLICGFIAAMGFGNEENSGASAAIDYLNGRSYSELSEKEKNELCGMLTHLEYGRLKEEGKLYAYLDPALEDHEDRELFAKDIYYENIFQIENDLYAYRYVSELYGEEYMEFSIIDNSRLDNRYMNMMLEHVEKEIISCKYELTKPVLNFLTYINVRKDRLNNEMSTRFEKVSAFYDDMASRVGVRTTDVLRKLCNYHAKGDYEIPYMSVEVDRERAYERINVILQVLEDSIDKNEIIGQDDASALFTYMYYTQEVMDEEMLARYKVVYDFYYPIYGSEEQGYGTVDWKPSLMLFIK